MNVEVKVLHFLFEEPLLDEQHRVEQNEARLYQKNGDDLHSLQVLQAQQAKREEHVPNQKYHIEIPDKPNVEVELIQSGVHLLHDGCEHVVTSVIKQHLVRVYFYSFKLFFD